MPNPMHILFLGDIVGTPGRTALAQHLPTLRQQHGFTAVVANAENAAAGRGLTPETAAEVFAAGVDVITLGDHTFDQRGIEDLLATHPRIIRPANYPTGTVGRGFTIFTMPTGQRLGVLNLQGRAFMRQLIDCPFQFTQRFQAEHQLGRDYDALLVDFHAETTSEKAVMAHMWDGHASLVVGTHTHIPTADTRIQPAGTAFQTDAGMCGDYHSSLGMSFESITPSMLSPAKSKFTPSGGPATLCGVMVQVAPTGLAQTVKRLAIGPHAG